MRPGGPEPARGVGALLALGFVVLAGGALRFWGLSLGLPYPLARPDEYLVLSHTRPIATGHPDPGWYIYPSFYLYLVTGWIEAVLAALRAAGFQLGLPSAAGGYVTLLDTRPEVLILLGRAGHALVGTATIGLAAAVARSLGGVPAALAAAAIVATNTLHVRDSHALKTDVLLAAACLVASWCCARLAAGASRRGALLAGAALGVALGIKQTALLLLLPLLVAAWLGVRTADERAAGASVLAELAAAGGTAALVFVTTSPFMAWNLFGPDFQVIWKGLLGQANFAAAGTAAGPAPSLAARYAYHLQVSLLGGCGFAATVLGTVAVGRALWLREPRRCVLAVFVVAWVAAIGTSSHRFSRYLTPVVPALAVLIGDCLVSVGARVPGPGARRLALVAGVLALVAEPLWASVHFDRLATRQDTRVAARDWLAAHTRPGETVLIAGTALWLYGAPPMPPGVRPAHAPVGPVTPETLARHAPAFVVTHYHPRVPFSAAGPGTLDAVASELTLVAEFDPFVAGEDPGLYEPQDAFYLPLRGFAGITRPGPLVRIYAVRSRPGNGAG